LRAREKLNESKQTIFKLSSPKSSGNFLATSHYPLATIHQPRPIHGPQKQTWSAPHIFGKRYSARRSLQQHVNARPSILYGLNHFFGNPWDQCITQTNDQVEIAAAIRSRKRGRELEPDAPNRAPTKTEGLKRQMDFRKGAKSGYLFPA
jgi:hypothetical protein